MGTNDSRISPCSCPFDQMINEKHEQAKQMPYRRGQASAFYFACANGELEKVRSILDSRASPSIEELNQLQDNGSTPLHAATHYGHIDVVRLLLERDCPRTTLNRFGKTAYDEAYTDEMKELFHRNDQARRFCEENVQEAIAVYLPENFHTDHNDPKINYVHLFRSESEVFEYSLNKQTTAMWLKFYNWFIHSFGSYIEREEFSVDGFDLHKHRDFHEFLQRYLSPVHAAKTLKSIHRACQENSIEPLINLYTSEAAGFYRPVNQALAQSSHESNINPHLCDRFLMEFYIHQDELKPRAFVGITYRGATISNDDLDIYIRAYRSEPMGVLGLRAFTSTSRNRSIAMRFLTGYSSDQDKRNVIFIFKIRQATSMIFAVDDVSVFSYEEEVLILPGTLFTVSQIEEKPTENLIYIHLEHLKVSVSFWRKIKQTLRAGQKSVL